MLLNHVFGMFTHPDDEWEAIRKEHSNPTQVYLAYVGLLALINPVCAYISTTYFGWQVGSGETERTIFLTGSSSIYLSCLTYIATLGGVFVLGWMVDWMADHYGGEHEENAATGIALVAYSVTPLFLAGFALLYPVPWFNMLVFLAAACYSGYLMYDGLPIVMKISKEQAVMFGGAILTAALVILVTTRVGSVIIWAMGAEPQFIQG